MDVVDEQHVAPQQIFPELHRVPVFAHQAVEVVDQVAAGHAAHPASFAAGGNFVGDGLEQMGLADAVGSVQKERIVEAPGLLGHRFGGRISAPVVLADDEVFEGGGVDVPAGQAAVGVIAEGGGQESGGFGLNGFGRRGSRGRGRPLFHVEELGLDLKSIIGTFRLGDRAFSGNGTRSGGFGGLRAVSRFEDVAVVHAADLLQRSQEKIPGEILDQLAEILVGHAQYDRIFFDPQRHHGLEPLGKAVFVLLSQPLRGDLPHLVDCHSPANHFFLNFFPFPPSGATSPRRTDRFIIFSSAPRGKHFFAKAHPAENSSLPACSPRGKTRTGLRSFQGLRSPAEISRGSSRLSKLLTIMPPAAGSRPETPFRASSAPVFRQPLEKTHVTPFSSSKPLFRRPVGDPEKRNFCVTSPKQAQNRELRRFPAT